MLWSSAETGIEVGMALMNVGFIGFGIFTEETG